MVFAVWAGSSWAEFSGDGIDRRAVLDAEELIGSRLVYGCGLAKDPGVAPRVKAGRLYGV